MDDWRVVGMPWSFIHAARCIRRRAASISVAMSASLNCLELGDRLSKLFPVFRILKTGFVSSLCHSDTKGCNADSAAIEDFQSIDESFAWFSKEILFRHTAVVKYDGGRVAGTQSKLVFLLPWMKAGHALFKNERGNAAVTGGCVRYRHSHADVAVGAMRGECLLAVENPMFPVEARSGLGACSITAGLGFGEAPCSELLAFR